jgi:transcriptional regulator with XRE-family HTH domain
MPNVDQAAKEWELELSRRVGTAVQTHRKALKLTAQQLAERTRDIGYPVSRVAISKIEGNLRAGKLDVAELLILAAALDVPPLVLLFPGLPDEAVEVIPGQPGTSWDGYLWATGRADGVALKGYRLIQAVLERNQLSIEIFGLLVDLGPKAHLFKQADLDVRDRSVSSKRARIAELNAEIRELGGVIHDA